MSLLTYFDLFSHTHTLMYSSGSLVDAAVNLMEECNSKMVAITDGAAGSIFATKNNVRQQLMEYTSYYN